MSGQNWRHESDGTAGDEEMKRRRRVGQENLLRPEIRERTESLIKNLEHVLREQAKLGDAADTLRRIADDLDIFHRNATNVNFVGSFAGVSGGLLALGGLLFAPAGGASLVVAVAGFAFSAAGGVTSAGASVVDAINSKIDKDKVEGLLKGCEAGLEKINERMKTASRLAEEIRDLAAAVNPDFGNMCVGVSQTGLHLSKLVKTIQVLNSGHLLAKIVGRTAVVLTAVFGVFDLVSMIRSAKELGRGAPSELARAIRRAEGELRAAVRELQVTDIERTVRELKSEPCQPLICL